MGQPDGARSLYRRLLSLYPKEFRERMAASMEQTFADSLGERRARGGHLIGFLAWAYTETTVGVMKERARRPLTAGWVAVAGGFVLVLPLMALEWMTRSPRPRTDFAFPLFILLWLCAVLVIRVSIGLVKTGLAISTGKVGVIRGSISVVATAALLGWVAWGSILLVIDQWPCFLGASGC
ncbi:MAG: hypothetical protein ACREJP_08500 [Candidatus Methylomirabilales bacterium]